MESRAVQGKTLTTPEPEATEDSERPELVDATRYDFDRLERAVSELAHQHALMQDENAALQTRLALRDATIQELESELEVLGRRRAAAIERVNRLVAELDRLDAEFEGDATS